MKVLYLANRAEIFGGGQISLLELVKSIDRDRFEIAVICPGEGGLTEAFRTMGATVYEWEMPSPKISGPVSAMSKISELRSLVREWKPDIVHANGSRVQFFATFALRGVSAGSVWHVRVSDRDIPFYDILLASRADAVICVSEAVKLNRFGKFLGSGSRFRVVHNAVDNSWFYPSNDARRHFRKEFALREDDPVIGYMANILPGKGHRFLFEAFSIVLKEMPETRLVIAGGEPDPAYAAVIKEEARKKGLADNVIFCGRREDTREVLNGLDVFVMPSANEGFSRVIIEAMACAVPVVVTDRGGNPEAVEHDINGFLVRYGDAWMMASKILELLKDKNSAAEKGAAGRQRVRESFSLPVYAAKIEKIYEEVAERKGCVTE